MSPVRAWKRACNRTRASAEPIWVCILAIDGVGVHIDGIRMQARETPEAAATSSGDLILRLAAPAATAPTTPRMSPALRPMSKLRAGVGLTFPLLSANENTRARIPLTDVLGCELAPTAGLGWFTVLASDPTAARVRSRASESVDALPEISMMLEVPKRSAPRWSRSGSGPPCSAPSNASARIGGGGNVSCSRSRQHRWCGEQPFHCLGNRGECANL